MAELAFDPIEHVYRLDGVVIPNVTRILGILDETWRVPAETLRAAAELGTAVHAACEYDDLGTLDESSVDADVWGYLEGWRRFRAETGFAPELIEARVFHPKLRYCGTLDRVGTLRGKHALLDIKSGAKWASHGPQTAAYQAAYEAEGGAHVARVQARYCLYLKSDGRYDLVPQKGKGDLSVFLAALTLTQYKEQFAWT